MIRAFGPAFAAPTASWTTTSPSGVSAAWSLPKNSMKVRAGCGVCGEEAATTACVRSQAVSSSAAQAAASNNGLYMEASLQRGVDRQRPGAREVPCGLCTLRRQDVAEQ